MTFVITYLTCIMMRRVIYARSVARLCCSRAVAVSSLQERASVAGSAHRNGPPRALVHPGGRGGCQGVGGAGAGELGFPAPACPLCAGSAMAGFSCISGMSELLSARYLGVFTALQQKSRRCKNCKGLLL